MNEEIVSGINSGNKKAFDNVFDLYFNALCAFCYRYINDQSDVEDIVQDAFVSFWEHKKEFKHINEIKAFLYTTTRNKSLNYLKHKTVLKKHQADLIYELESEQFFIQHVIEEEAFNHLYSEINQLPPSAQKVMILALKGLKNHEIATELGISENTVKTQKKIAYAKLKSKLNPVINGILLSL